MPYTTNPNMPKVRKEAAMMVLKDGKSTREAARHFGYNQSTIVRWVQHAKLHTIGHGIPTKSSKPHSHPKKLSPEMVQTIIEYRLKHQRCAQVLHYLLKKDGYDVSLSSVKRTLKRNGLIKHSKWKKWHQYEPRPLPESPGILVQIDTIHDGPHHDRLYLYTMIDVCSRWAYATACERISAQRSWKFVQGSQIHLPFQVQTLQSDHGPEFSKHFKKQLKAHDINHRHTHIRKPTENGHLERFNRTIQEECINRVPKTLEAYQKIIPDFLHFYNHERPHMGIEMQTPFEVMQSY